MALQPVLFDGLFNGPTLTQNELDDSFLIPIKTSDGSIRPATLGTIRSYFESTTPNIPPAWVKVTGDTTMLPGTNYLAAGGSGTIVLTLDSTAIANVPVSIHSLGGIVMFSAPDHAISGVPAGEMIQLDDGNTLTVIPHDDGLLEIV